MPPLRILMLVLAATMLAAESFSGSLTAIEVLRGPRETTDREELERLAATVDARLRQHREALPGARPLAARVLREDLGFLQAEQERIVLRGGGDLTIATTTFVLHQGRLLAQGDDQRLQVDRHRNLALSEIAGVVRPVGIAPLPLPTTVAPTPGPEALGRATTARDLRLGNRKLRVLALEGLPNPWAIGLVEGASPEDLASVLATVPGLPVLATWEDAGLTRELRVTAITPGPVDERLFVPWPVTDP